MVLGETTISDTVGGFGGVLDNNDQFGRSVTNLGDLDGDGVVDLAVGAMLDDDGGTDRGAVWVLFMNADGTVRAEQKISSTAGGFAGALDNGDRFGMSVAGLGDLDGDGVEDLAVGARGDDDGGTNRGAAWVLFLNADGTVRAHQKISDLVGGFMGVLGTGDGFGASLAAIGDLDGDGRPDLAVGATLFNDGGSDKGAVWVLFLNADGTVRAEQQVSDTAGGVTGLVDSGDQFGSSIAGIGDFNGDGVRDLAVGAAFDDDGGVDRGSVWLLFLNTDGTVRAEAKISDTVSAFGGVLDDGDQFGMSVAAVGDLNGYDAPDLCIGASGDDDGGPNRGALWIVFMIADATVRSQHKIASASFGLDVALEDGDGFGVSLSNLGDRDGNGHDDLAVGAPLDDDGGADRGAVWVLPLDGCRPVCCEGDADSNGVVEFADITQVLTNWGSELPQLAENSGDANCNCRVEFDDVTAVLTNFGMVCPE